MASLTSHLAPFVADIKEELKTCEAVHRREKKVKDAE
jgi:hypothetical protein